MSKYYILVIIALVGNACTEDRFSNVVEIELPEHQPGIAISVEWTTQDSVLQVFVSKSSPILGTDVGIEPLENANVEVFRNDVSFANLTYNPTSKFYEKELGTLLENDGASYRVEVSAPNYATVSAIQTMPRKGFIENLNYSEGTGISSYGYETDELRFDVVDVEGADYYGIEVWYYEAFDDGNGGFYESLNQVYLESIDTQLEDADYGQRKLLKDVSFDGGKYRVNLSIDLWNQNASDIDTKLIVRLSNMTQENYFYQRSLEQYMRTEGNPFAEPVVVFDNIENGHGIFRMSNMQVFELDL